MSLLRLPVPPLRENCTENSMEEWLGKVEERISAVWRLRSFDGDSRAGDSPLWLTFSGRDQPQKFGLGGRKLVGTKWAG